MEETIYTEILDADKQALIDGTVAIKTKIIVLATDTKEEIILTESNSVKDWEHNDERYVPETGFIGQFIARTLKGNLQDIDDDFNIEDREIELRMGIVRLGTRYQWLSTDTGDILIDNNGNQIYVNDLGEDMTTWYSLGNFYVTKPEGDEVRDNTSFEAMDYTTNFNIDFDANFTSTSFPTSFNETIANGGNFTAKELAEYTCEQANVLFGNDSFTQSDFEITTNQFTEGNSCRDVMKEISKIAYGWCAIHWDNKCYIDEPMGLTRSAQYNTLTYDNYYSLKTQKNTYGPVNRIVIGSSSIDGQESVLEDTESIAENGLTEITILDNPILYTKALQDDVISGANNLMGLNYTPLTTETPGHPWYHGNELILVKDMEQNNRYTYPFNRTIKYNGHIKTTLTSTADTKQGTLKSFKRALFKELREVHIQVNKQDGVIETLNSKVQASTDGLEALETRFSEITTDTYTRQEIQEIISGVAEDGTVVSSVTTTAGTFDKNGLTIEQSTADTATNINADGMIIYNKTSSVDDPLLTVNSNGVIAKNIKVQQYLNIGTHSRIEDYTHTDYTEGTGVFWIGSDS